MTIKLSEIVKRAPVDRTAASVSSRSLETAFEPKIADSERFSPTPLLVRRNPTFSKKDHDLTGRTFGRFTVAGLSVEGKTSRGYGRWVVRCICGWYCVRSTQTLKNHDSESLMCPRYLRIEKMRGGSQ